jgi:transketolase
MTVLEKRIIEISYKLRLSHLGSCLTAVGIIDEIFRVKKTDEKFILSCGHAGLALYVVLEKYKGIDAENLFYKCGVHPDRLDGFPDIDCSTGSLGQGLPIALGMAMADRTKNVYCLISDGESAEGSIYEALNIRRKYKVDNLVIYCNFNGWGAYDEADLAVIESLHSVILRKTNFDAFPFLKGQEAHYHVLTDVEYAQAIC